jgi:signal transduction histidine kinase
VESVVDELRTLAQEYGVTLHVDVPASLAIDADVDGVRTIARNLVHNAIKASRGSHGEVTIRATEDARGVTLYVEDTGVGFAPAESNRLFEKFYRVERNGNGRLPGAGLGLFLVRRCAEMDGATVSAFSEGPDRGARFSVVWPPVNANGGDS